MGLDVYWYKGLMPGRWGQEHLSRKQFARYLETHGKIVKVNNLDVYGDRSRPYPRTNYSYTECGKVCSMAYSDYGLWREALAVASGWAPLPDCVDDKPHTESAQQAEGGPFWELICFADNEGFIGSEASNRLWRDFCKFTHAFEAYVNRNSQIERPRKAEYLKIYHAFGDAFTRCASEGGVRFS